MQEDRKLEAAELHNKTLARVSHIHTHAHTHTLLAPAAHWGMMPLVSMHPASAGVSQAEPTSCLLVQLQIKEYPADTSRKAAETALLGFAMN